jgi:hypothetical protein
VADKGIPGRRPGRRPRAWRPHATLFSMEPQLAAVWRLVVVVAALWVVLFVLR